jgi:RNA polymerase sigma-70 factor (ECF subfamily)
MDRGRPLHQRLVKDAIATANALELHGYHPAAARDGAFSEAVPSFDEVYAKHARFVWRVLRGMGIREAGIDDAVQDVFIVVHRRLPEFDGKHALSTWLFAIAYRVACDHRRKHKRSSSLEPLDEDAPQVARSDAPSPAENAEQAQRIRTLHDALDTLDDEKRALIVLAELEEQTVPQIAALTGTSVNTVYTRLRRARIELHNALDKSLVKKGGSR